jgi:hypothetical protein
MPRPWPDAGTSATSGPDEPAAPTRAQLIGVGVFTAWIVIGRIASGEAWVPLLDGANLLIHEAGHPLVGLFSERLMVYGGTVFQLLFPALVAQHFRRRGEPVGTAVGLIWLGESLLNVARYMADARAQLLPLVGGGEHDWTEIFTRWGVLGGDRVIAAITALLGWGLMAATWLWLLAAWRRAPHD